MTPPTAHSSAEAAFQGELGPRGSARPSRSEPVAAAARAAGGLELVPQTAPASLGQRSRPRRVRGVAARLVDSSRWQLIRLAIDFVLLYAGVIVATAADTALGTPSFLIWLLPLAVLGLLVARGDYRPRLALRTMDRISQAVAAASVGSVAVIGIASLLQPTVDLGGPLVRAWLLATAALVATRALLGLVEHHARATRVVAKPTLIVGAGRVGVQIERRLDSHPQFGLRPVGYLDADPVAHELLPARRAPVLGAPSDLARVAAETGVRHVIIGFTSEPDEVLLPFVRECQRLGLDMSLVPRLFDSVTGRVELDHMGGLPLYGVRPVNPRSWAFEAKDLISRSLAALLLVALAPVIASVAAAVKLTSPGPVLFRQRRIGRDGSEFDVLKFRSMQVADARGPAPDDRPEASAAATVGNLETALAARDRDADTAPGGIEHGRALTPVGGLIRRTSLDELPQLWNVLKGEMALVGPRPERPEFVELFGRSIPRYDDRHRVRAGVTGWAQVHGLRGRSSLADRVEWDNYYIENWSLWLDLKILLLTLVTPFRRAE